jgi:hypothetical protein
MMMPSASVISAASEKARRKSDTISKRSSGALLRDLFTALSPQTVQWVFESLVVNKRSLS